MAAERKRESRIREKPQQIADELRALIVSGELAEGDQLGHEPELVERFGVSRPSLREALRILEAEGLITVVRGVRGGVIAHEPDERMTARTAATVLQARNVPLADVFEARALLEPLAARTIASSRRRRSAVSELRDLIDDEAAAIEDPEAFGRTAGAFHERLVALAGNQTLTIVAEMLNEILVKAVAAVSWGEDVVGSVSTPSPHPLPAAAPRPHRGRRGDGGRRALAEPHGCDREGDAGAGGRQRGRSPRPPLRGVRVRSESGHHG
ncbi:MAG: GntR family transcriptional regulator [Acidimicrobiales bacterium]